MQRVLHRYGAVLVAVAVFAILAPLALRQPFSYDGARMRWVAISLAEHGTPVVKQTADRLGLNTPYSSYGIGMSVVFAPLYLLGRAVGGDAVKWTSLAGPFLFAATCGVVIETLRRRRYPAKVVALTAAIVLVGSPLLAYAITDFAEPGLALMVALAVLALDGIARGTRFAALGAGAAAGGAVLFRTDSLLLIAVPVAVAALVLASRRPRAAAYLAAGIAPALAVVGWYNAARFGSPFDAGYGAQPFSHSLAAGVYGLTLSPGRGILVYAPMIIVAIVVARSLRGTDRVLAVLALVLVALRIVFFARWWAWYGGAVWGPRFVLAVLPAFGPVIGAALIRWPASRPIVAAGLAGLLMAFIGLFVTIHPERNAYRPPSPRGFGRVLIARATSAEHVRTTDRIMFDWSRFPMLG